VFSAACGKKKRGKGWKGIFSKRKESEEKRETLAGFGKYRDGGEGEANLPFLTESAKERRGS